MIKNIGFIGSLITILVLTLYTTFKKKKIDRIITLLKDKGWLINFIFIIVWSTYILLLDDKTNSDELQKVKESIKKAMIAFIIAFFAYLDLTIAPFWLVFTFAYYSEGWI